MSGAAEDAMVEHNIDCYYALQQDGAYAPVLVCSCGFKSCEESWEEAGMGMDEHLIALAARDIAGVT